MKQAKKAMLGQALIWGKWICCINRKR